MSQFGSVVGQQLRLQRLSVIMWSLVMALMVYAVAGAAPSVTQGNIGEEVVKGLGMEGLVGGTPADYVHRVDWYITFKFMAWLPLMLGIFSALSVLGIVSREEERHNSDFLLSLPVDRKKLISGRFLGSALATAIVTGVTYLALCAGLQATGETGSYDRYAIAFGVAYLITLSLGSISLFISLFFSSYGRALRYAMGLLTGLFVYDLSLALASKDLHTGILGKITPFGWYDATSIIKDGIFPIGSILFSLVITAVFIWLSATRYTRREIL